MKPLKPTLMATTTSMTMRATHWSCGQYVPATTGARLKPMSMTTAPVTAGGSSLWITPVPMKWMMRPTMKSVSPVTNIAPVRSDGLPPAP